MSGELDELLKAYDLTGAIRRSLAMDIAFMRGELRTWIQEHYAESKQEFERATGDHDAAAADAGGDTQGGNP